MSILTRVTILAICAALSVGAVFGYSPTIWIDPQDPTHGPFSFELQEETGSRGERICTLKVTIAGRDFHPGARLSLMSILDPAGNTDQNVRSGRDLEFTHRSRTLVSQFVLTKEEAEDTDLAFLLSEPVIVISEGKVFRPPSITFCFGWVHDFLAGDEYSEKARRDRVAEANRKQGEIRKSRPEAPRND